MRPGNINQTLAARISDTQPVDKNKPLFVPMHLSAFVVGKQSDKIKWAPFTPKYPKLNSSKSAPVGATIEANICRGLVSDQPHFEGVHLHWVLPDAYRHGVQNEDGSSPEFPLVPNRWLVTRFAEKNKEIVIKRWVVESDYIDTNSNEPNRLTVNKRNTSLLLNAGDTFSTIQVGRELDYDVRLETKEKDQTPFLTIMAPGDPSFAANYTSSQKSFGFHDKLEGLDETSGECSYSVMGWLTDPAKDLLAISKDGKSEITTGKAWLEKMATLAWDVADDIDATEALPGRIICHSMINNVKWDKNKQTEKGVSEDGKPTGDVKVALGNTVSEALAALISQNNNKETDKNYFDAVNPYLSAMQYNVLADHVADKGSEILEQLKATNGPDAATRALQNNNHAKGFRSVDGGVVWQVARPQKRQSADAEMAKDEQPLPMQKDTAEKLAALNKIERDHDESMSMLLYQQEKRYANWYKSLRIVTSDDPDQPPLDLSADEISLLQAKLGKDNEQITRTLKNLSGNGTVATAARLREDYKDKVEAAKKTLTNALNNDPNYKGFEIKEAKLPPYYLPNDPTVILDGLYPSPIYTRSGKILCRLEKQLANQLSAKKTVNYKELHDKMGLKYDRVPAGCSSLMIEQLLFCPLAANAAAIQACNDKCSDTQLTELAEQIAEIARNWEAHTKEIGRGTGNAVMPETFSVKQRKFQPWIPIIMEWELEWYPARSRDLAGNWEFGSKTTKTALNNIDYAAKDNAISDTPTATFRGRVALSSDLRKQLDDLKDGLGGADLFAGMEPMHQALSGLDRHFLNQESGIQLPPLIRQGGTMPVDAVINEIEDQYLWRPSTLANGFYPLRGGAFRIKKLYVIDAFGQNLPVITTGAQQNNLTDLHVPASLATSGDKLKIVLPPRICQPARMRLKWLSATADSRETDSDPASSPLCGWMMHNKLDESIMFFDADGIALGSLGITSEGKLNWEDPPGARTKKLLSANLNMNGHLKSMADVLISGSIYSLRELLCQMDDMAEKALKARKKSGAVASLPFGVPMAVVRAACALELDTPPASPQGLLAADDDLAGTAFPFYMGSTLNRNDGVVAVLHTAQPGMLTTPFAQYIRTPGATFATDNPAMLQIGTGRSGPATNITMLVHPHMDVTISSGILPTASYTLPDLNANKAMEKISMSFLVNPFLVIEENSNKTEPSIPVPDIEGKKWEWIQQHFDSSANGPLWKEAGLSSGKDLLLNFSNAVVIKEGWLKMEQKDDN